jgi:hypothetical protein
MKLMSHAWVRWFATLFVFALIIRLTFGEAYAVEARAYQLENGGSIAPHLRVDIGTDSNPLRGDDGSESSAYFRAQPSVKYFLRRRNNELSIGYSGDYFQYFTQYCNDPVTAGFFSVNRPGDCLSEASPEFNKASYQNHELELNSFLEFSRRARADIQLATVLVNQPLGTGLSGQDSVLTLLERPDAFVRNSARFGFSYGASQARGELRFGLSMIDRSFRENAGRTLDTLDERIEPSAQILYRIGSRTQIIAGLRFGDVSRGDSERSTTSQFFGLEFDATAITSGRITLSAVNEEFDNPGRSDISYGGFDIDLTWRPRRFSTVTITGGRRTQRATLSEGLGINTRLDLDWVHFWRDRFSTSARIGLDLNDSDDGIGFNDANDRTRRLRLVGNYNVLRWLDVGAFVQSENRTGENADGESRDYSRTLIGLTTNGTF